MIGRPLDRCALGAQAEERAAQLLQQAGFRIVLRNYRWRGGELDLVARRRELARLNVRFDAVLAAGAGEPLEWLQDVM